MKKIVLIIVAVLIVVGGVVFAINRPSSSKSGEMKRYVEMVRKLQKGDEKSHQEVLSMLRQDDQWTLLDDIGDPAIDEDKRYMTLRLNDVAYQAAMAKYGDYGNPQGVFVSGTNMDYSICFIEKTIAAGSSVTYLLDDRGDSEIVAVVEMANGDLDVWVNGDKIRPSKSLFVSKPQSGEISLRLRNRRGYAVNFVIINQH